MEQLEKIQDKVGAKPQKICDGTSEPMNQKEIIKVVQHGPQEHVQNCTGEHAVDVPIRVIKMNLAKKYLEMLAEIAEKKDDCEKSYGQFGTCLKLGIHKSFIDVAEVAKLLRFNTSKSDDEQTKLKGDIGRMKGGQHDIYYITARVSLLCTQRWSRNICARNVMRYSTWLTLHLTRPGRTRSFSTTFFLHVASKKWYYGRQEKNCTIRCTSHRVHRQNHTENGLDKKTS